MHTIGDVIPWSQEEMADRKINKDVAMKKREEIMAKIKHESPDDTCAQTLIMND